MTKVESWMNPDDGINANQCLKKSISRILSQGTRETRKIDFFFSLPALNVYDSTKRILVFLMIFHLN